MDPILAQMNAVQAARGWFVGWGARKRPRRGIDSPDLFIRTGM